MSAKLLTTRFAPTPNGHLHLGNFYNLIWVGVLAQKHSARVGLRIDDYDQTRYRSHFVDGIFEVLNIAGFEWDFGPRDRADFETNFSSRHRIDLYRAAELKLKSSSQTYWCTCTRKQAGEGIYSGRCRDRGLTEMSTESDLAAQLRLRIGEEPLATEIGDVIVVPRAGEVAYQVASIVDDVHYGYNFLVRGEDLRPSSELQKKLAREIGYESFASDTKFYHHKLLQDSRGEKLSKSQKSNAVVDLLKQEDGLAMILKSFAATELGLPNDKKCPRLFKEFTEYAAALI